MRHGVSKEYLNGSRRGRRNYRSFPFDRFLQSRLGRPWNDVYAEVCQEFDSRSYRGQQFLHILEWNVNTHCWIEDGVIYCHSPYVGTRPVDEYYVHPETGLLSYAEPIKRHYPVPPCTHIKIDDLHFYDKIDGIWYYSVYEVNPYYVHWSRFEDRKILIVSKRQLGKKELRKLGLVNGPVPLVKKKTKNEFLRLWS
jgi:hypothetical protein